MLANNNNFSVIAVLYRKNNLGNVCEWSLIKDTLHNYYTEYRVLGGAVKRSKIICTHKDVNVFVNRVVADKRKIGYKSLDEVKDNTELPTDEQSIKRYLEAYLPDFRSNADGDKLHMLATTYKYGDEDKRQYVYQPKINGLRCGIFPYRTDDMFTPIRLRFQSREGGEFVNLLDLEAYILNHLEHSFLDELIERNAGLDGELYIHRKSLNEINSAVKNIDNPDNKKVEFWCYDLIEDTMNQMQRFDYLRDELHKYISFNNNYRFKYLGYSIIDDFLSTIRDNSIDYGFEGIILRDLDGMYQYGKRNKTMLKYKRATDGVFEIIDIVPQSLKRPDLPMIIVRNDINNEKFECKLSEKEDMQAHILKNREFYLGRKVFLTYGERSGVKQVPFHIKTCKIV